RLDLGGASRGCEGLGECSGTLEPLGRIDRQGPRDGLLHIGRDRRTETAYPRCGFGEPLGHDRHRGGTLVWRLAREQLIEYAAETVHVAPAIEGTLAGGLFRTHVLGGAERHARA